ncbi:MAG: DNA polymerase [Oscillospiraceae bacterium]
MPQEMVTGEMRSRAKAVNFGIVYGIGAFSLSKDIGVSRREADEYIKEYLKNYSGVDSYMKRVAEEAREKGYVETMFGRRRYLPELKSTNFNMRAFGERVARNMPIQGAAADIIKIAMIRVSDRLEREGLQAKLILRVHDELIVECPEGRGGAGEKPADRRDRDRLLSASPWWRKPIPAGPVFDAKDNGGGQRLERLPPQGGCQKDLLTLFRDLHRGE